MRIKFGKFEFDINVVELMILTICICAIIICIKS